MGVARPLVMTRHSILGCHDTFRQTARKTSIFFGANCEFLSSAPKPKSFHTWGFDALYLLASMWDPRGPETILQ